MYEASAMGPYNPAGVVGSLRLESVEGARRQIERKECSNHCRVDQKEGLAGKSE